MDDLGYGLKALDVNISSVAQDINEHFISGIPGSVITGFTDRSREMNIIARIKAKDTTDFRLKRDRVFAFFKRLGTFYITENNQGNKLMKVRVTDSYRLDRIENNQTFSIAEIPLKIIGQPYWISRYKSMDLHENDGVPFNSRWSFGMGLDVDPNRLKYQFSNQPSFVVYNAGTVPLKTIQEKDNCLITIEVKQTVTDFRVRDTTGKYFEYNPKKDSKWALSSGNKVTLNGHYIHVGNTSAIDRTNRYFPIILSGDNLFTVEGLSTYTITFDFCFKYD
nr:phage tail domain-containing protein [Cytobacillus horneckiae]